MTQGVKNIKLRNKKIYYRITTLDKADDFDLWFWKKAGVQARFSAAWTMLKDYYRIKGKNGVKLRLRRSVQNIEQIQS